MRTYFRIDHGFATDAFKLKVDYSVTDVHDTLALDRPEPTPKGFLEAFTYTGTDGETFEDMLANDMGWNIFSARLTALFSQCRNCRDLELLSLPAKVCQLHPKLAEYRVLGIKREISCLDIEESDLRWDTLPNGRRHVAAIYECVLKERAIPEDVDVFQIAEYPVTPIISSRLAMEIAKYRPTGLVYYKIQAVTHQE